MVDETRSGRQAQSHAPGWIRAGRRPGKSRRRAGGWRAAHWARRVVQIAGFAAFVYLLFAALRLHDAHPFADIFFRFDPLAAFGTMLAARTWLPDLGLAIITVVVTIALGRAWCGWLCPLGTFLGWLRFGSARRAAKRLPRPCAVSSTWTWSSWRSASWPPSAA